jgi:hypothetical protein
MIFYIIFQEYLVDYSKFNEYVLAFSFKILMASLKISLDVNMPTDSIVTNRKNKII